MVFRPQPQEKIRTFWTFIAFPLSGLGQGVVGMGGPPMVFWVQAHDWDGRKMRAFLFSMYLVSIGPGLLVLALFFGNRIVEPCLITLAVIPLLLLVTILGVKLGSWMGTIRLRRVSLILLFLMGLAGIAAPWISPN